MFYIWLASYYLKFISELDFPSPSSRPRPGRVGCRSPAGDRFGGSFGVLIGREPGSLTRISDAPDRSRASSPLATWRMISATTLFAGMRHIWRECRQVENTCLSHPDWWLAYSSREFGSGPGARWSCRIESCADWQPATPWVRQSTAPISTAQARRYGPQSAARQGSAILPVSAHSPTGTAGSPQRMQKCGG
jgi:hypothetical protein